jgi:hypothetical protein
MNTLIVVVSVVLLVALVLLALSVGELGAFLARESTAAAVTSAERPTLTRIGGSNGSPDIAATSAT